MRILIVGASGFIGGRIALELKKAGHEVALCGRNARKLRMKFPEDRVFACNFSIDKSEDWMSRLAHVDAVINAAGIFRPDRNESFQAAHINGPRALFDACVAVGVRKVLQISALGADAEANSQFHLSKREADDSFVALGEKHGLAGWIVLRPSLVVGRGGQSTALFAALGALPRPIRIGPGDWRVQPIHVADLACAVRFILESENSLPWRLDLAGPEPMTTDEVTLAMRRWLLLPPSPYFLPMPEQMLRLIAKTAKFAPIGPLTGESLAMLARGNTADIAPLRHALKWRPRTLSQALLSDPSTEADLWHARLFFLRPALRIGLGVFWVATGVISAFIYPIEKSVGMEAGLGLSGWQAMATLYVGAALDAGLGLALIANMRPALIGLLQIAVMTAYTVLATIAVPEASTEPFGPLTKNLPILLASLIMIALEAER